MKPGIIIVSDNTEDTFRWLSDGWFEESARNTPEAQELMKKVTECVRKAKTRDDAVVLLERAGFEVMVTDQS